MRMLPRFDLFYLVSLWTDNTGTLRASFTSLSLSPSLSASSFYIKTISSYFFLPFFLSSFFFSSPLPLSLYTNIRVSSMRILKGLRKVKIDAWLKLYSVAEFCSLSNGILRSIYTLAGETKVDIAKYVSRRLFFVIRGFDRLFPLVARQI